MEHSKVKIEKIDLTLYFKLKASSKKYYITIPPIIRKNHDLMVGDSLKITLVERRRFRTDE